MKIEAIGKPEGCKLLRITAELTEPSEGQPLITSISIRGDFFFVPEEYFEKIESSLIGISLDKVAQTFDSLAAQTGCMLAGINGKGIVDTIIKEIS